MRDFAGKVAVITGAGRGIGRGIALRCAQEGMVVVLAGIGLDSLTRTEADLKAMGATTLVVQTDVRKVEHIERLAQRTVDVFGAAHMLVNNAGVAVVKTVWESSLSDWQWVMGVNFWGVLYGVRVFIPIMLAQDTDCHVVNVSSVNGIMTGSAGFGSYNVSKHAVVALSETLYFELARHAPHIKVSVYCPGQINTDLIDCERNRPSELHNDADTYRLTPDEQARLESLRKRLTAGMSIEESAGVLFRGIREDKLYIGPLGFRERHPGLISAVQRRADNIVTEHNPEIRTR